MTAIINVFHKIKVNTFEISRNIKILTREFESRSKNFKIIVTISKIVLLSFLNPFTLPFTI
jgi:hypothetical protein